MNKQGLADGLVGTVFETLPLGAVKPAGWLKDQLRIQADGLTGHLDEHWEDVGPRNGWLGGDGESWERGPYYVDGLLPLAYLLNDETLIAKARKWVEWSLSSQQKDGSFGPGQLDAATGKIIRHRDWWHNMIMLKVLSQYAEVTGDERIIPFMTNYFRYLRSVIEEQPLVEWARARSAELLLSLYWLYKRTEDASLLELADIVSGQMLDWTGTFSEFPFWNKVEEWNHRTHGVNLAMAVKSPAALYMLTGDESRREAVYRGIDSLMTYHGQAHGMFSGDEWLSGTHPSQGVELCAVVEYMYSMEQLIRIFGDGRFGDILEKIAFNALPATISADWTSHQYDQQVNQVACNIAKRSWSNDDDANLFGLEPNYGCCTANMHQGWPKFAAHLWMSRDGGLAAVAYAPCTVEATVRGGVRAALHVETDYPFRDSVSINVKLERGAIFPLYLRIPAWCGKPSVSINGGAPLKFKTDQQFAVIERDWQDGDVVRLVLPMEARRMTRSNGAASVECGPLVYVLPIAENWQLIREREKFHDWEVFPATQWKYGLAGDASFEQISRPLRKQPFLAVEAPVALKTKGRLVLNWTMVAGSADAPPLNPKAEGPVVDLELVPYGSARLRIGEFPVV